MSGDLSAHPSVLAIYVDTGHNHRHLSLSKTIAESMTKQMKSLRVKQPTGYDGL